MAIVQAPSSLSLGTLSVVAGGRWANVATLRISGLAPGETQTVYFTATDAAGRTYFISALTNPDGVVTIPSWPLAAGDYSLTAFFAEVVPLGGGKTLDARSRYYAGSHTAAGTLHVGVAGVTYTGDTDVLTGANINLRASVTPAALAATAQVRYVVRRNGLTAYATPAVPAGTAGNWLATINGGLLPGTYSVHTYIVGTSQDGEGPVATLTVKYRLCLQYDPTKAVKSGSTIPIKLQLCSASGLNMSAGGITVHAVSLTQTSGNVTGTVDDPGNANPDLDFRFAGDSYIYNLSTKGLRTGTWTITFTVVDQLGGTSTQSYTTTFQVK